MSTPIDASHKAQFWDTLWTNGTTPWDLGNASKALLSVLKSHETVLFPPQKETHTVLIPGAGRGYDVIAFAQKP
ncbi:hypothetical protein HDU98_005038, partial [Podochytrium sp. JEL0797]